ncbi:hypothetical protein SeLEV6574_g06426 [Synchytrium endobioticum]|uniref:Uncharacterized protein n=1 Tax=Synchytrium endobioticum TaxID=286115 RepID=A0A507CNQ0_9FUNG|nr:hypothetical protein SeLEV6574_g06426 [Synchytrium endobioticum]
MVDKARKYRWSMKPLLVSLQRSDAEASDPTGAPRDASVRARDALARALSRSRRAMASARSCPAPPAPDGDGSDGDAGRDVWKRRGAGAVPRSSKAMICRSRVPVPTHEPPDSDESDDDEVEAEVEDAPSTSDTPDSDACGSPATAARQDASPQRNRSPGASPPAAAAPDPQEAYDAMSPLESDGASSVQSIDSFIHPSSSSLDPLPREVLLHVPAQWQALSTNALAYTHKMIIPHHTNIASLLPSELNPLIVSSIQNDLENRPVPQGALLRTNTHIKTLIPKNIKFWVLKDDTLGEVTPGAAYGELEQRPRDAVPMLAEAHEPVLHDSPESFQKAFQNSNIEDDDMDALQSEIDKLEQDFNSL